MPETSAADPNSALYHYQLGNLHWSEGRTAEAVACFERAREIDPQIADLPYQEGLKCARASELAEAEMWLWLASAFRPGHSPTLACLGDVLRRLGRLDEALPLLEQAVRLAPESWEAHADFGIALCEAGRLEEASALLEHALSPIRKPQILNNLAVVRRCQGRIGDALQLLDEAIRLQPVFPDAHLNRATALLSIGRFEEGWREYEWRPTVALHPDLPLAAYLDAGVSLAGKTVLLHEEQGLGDLIQFVRYAAPLAQRGAKVLVQCREAFAPLIRGATGVAGVIPVGVTPPRFDLNAHLLSLPGILHPASAPIPVEFPYLSVDAERVLRWRGHIGNGTRLRVGIVWGGNPGTAYDRRRSIPLARLEPILRVPDAAFFSLQRGPRASELEALDPGIRVIDIEKDAGGVLDTAAVMLCLDLVISADTMTAHLAGALGRPVWVLLPFAADWRWMLEREDSPWYPSMRLFRQPRAGEWDAVANRLADELRRHGS